MRLSEFILLNKPAVIGEWISFAESLTPAASSMTRLQLEDHIELILDFIASDLESEQTTNEQFNKSQGNGAHDGAARTASEIHGNIRHADGFDVVQMVSEYRALRASIVKLWSRRNKQFTETDMDDLVRFNESIDQSLAESVRHFMIKVDYSKDLLLGILGHDIRSPLGAITMSSRLMTRVGSLNKKQTALNDQIEGSGIRVSKIVTDLLDLTRARLGTRLPIDKHPMDIEELANQILTEMRVQNPNRVFVFHMVGDNQGNWDRSRLGQVFSNLIGNAIQYGLKEAPITITIEGNEDKIGIKIHNLGAVIPPSQQAIIFGSFTRGKGSAQGNNPQNVTANLGLGLFITKEIIDSHEGSIEVISKEGEGTSFNILLPRGAEIDKALDEKKATQSF